VFTGKKVKIRFKRYFSEQRVRVFVGVVLEMGDGWIKAQGKNYYLVKGDTRPHIDASNKVIGVPRENVYAIRVLPDELELDRLTFEIKDLRMVIRIPGGEVSSISE